MKLVKFLELQIIDKVCEIEACRPEFLKAIRRYSTLEEELEHLIKQLEQVSSEIEEDVFDG